MKLNQIKSDYDEKAFSLTWVGTKNGRDPLELLHEAEPIFEAVIARGKRIVNAGIGDDATFFYKGWKLTLKGGMYARKKKGADHKGEAVREESSGAQEP